jgi:hypothetical protein
MRGEEILVIRCYAHLITAFACVEKVEVKVASIEYILAQGHIANSSLSKHMPRSRYCYT